jgi:hypothetical protein
MDVDEDRSNWHAGAELPKDKLHLNTDAANRGVHHSSQHVRSAGPMPFKKESPRAQRTVGGSGLQHGGLARWTLPIAAQEVDIIKCATAIQ